MTVIQRPCSWGELVVAVLMGIAIGWFAAIGMLGFSIAEAGEVDVTWAQPADCDVVARWEVLAVTLPNPQATPEPALVVATIPNTNLCPTLPTTRRVSVNMLGPTRFAIRAVKTTTPALTSGLSNTADASVPLGKPSGFQAVAP